MQGEFGFPSVFRLSDPEETSIAFRLYGVADTVIDKMLAAKGYKDGKRVLMLGWSEGEKHFSKNVAKQIDKICKKHGAMYTTSIVTKGWEKGRFTDPYLREDMGDYGLMLDTSSVRSTGITSPMSTRMSAASARADPTPSA